MGAKLLAYQSAHVSWAGPVCLYGGLGFYVLTVEAVMTRA